VSVETPEPAPRLTHEEAAALAARHSLRRLGARPPLRAYIRALVRRRHFIWALASSDALGRNQGSYLGQLWGVVNPLLQFSVFFLVFGYVLKMNKGVDDFVSYLAVGTFLFGFMASGLTVGSKAVVSRLQLVRALEFPRAVLPISVTLTEMIMMWPALVVMLVIVLARGHRPTWTWFLLIPDVALMYLFTLGCALALARIVSATPDFANLVPVATSLLRFMSGVFYNITQFTKAGSLVGILLTAQPFAVYLELARGALLTGYPVQSWHWFLAVGWAALSLVIGFVFFWRAEARYGRD
jgi:teichoic acid transport system permease protein